MIRNSSCRGMALCFIMMSGRVGAIVGSNYTGALIEGYCDGIFILNASILLGKTCFKYFTRLSIIDFHFQLALSYATSLYKQLIRSESRVAKKKPQILTLMRLIRPK